MDALCIKCIRNSAQVTGIPYRNRAHREGRGGSRISRLFRLELMRVSLIGTGSHFPVSNKVKFNVERQFWIDRWQNDRIGFHRDEVSPFLTRHWSALGLQAGSRVLVPLAGKSLDMLWLANSGHRVLGVELSSRAVAQFLADNKLAAVEHESAQGRRYSSGDIELICGDVFDLDKASVAECAAVYDRAALIALPADMRRHYASLLTRILPAKCSMLLITLDYRQTEMTGPPFAVDEQEVHALYGANWQVDKLEARDILDQEPHFADKGLTSLQTVAYRLYH